MNKAELISRIVSLVKNLFLGFSILIIIFSLTRFAWGYEDPVKPGSYLNPYVIKPSPFGDSWEIRPKYPTFNEKPFAPGSYFNPYIIKKRPFSNEYEIKPKYPTFGY
ncbi:MAG: hypothetical protein GU354_04805 [Caldimicrobium sp.]|jgi:hypothetical protein|nr:hypothetical protein [Caldimicrobium sp.]